MKTSLATSLVNQTATSLADAPDSAGDAEHAILTETGEALELEQSEESLRLEQDE